MTSYLAAVDDAVCQYQNETLEARGVMAFIRELDHESGGTLGTLLTEENELVFRVAFGLAKSFEAAATKMCDMVREAEKAEHERQRAQ